jgi:hypothetical protein
VSAFAQELAVVCVSQHTDEKGAGYIHVRSLSKTAVISVGLVGVHCPEARALEHVRAAIVGLVEEGIEECRRQIAAAGLPVPPKSACFFCPAMPPAELEELCREHPDLARRIAVLELNAAPQLLSVEGLWRKASKKRPGSMVQFLAEHHPEVLFVEPTPVSEGLARPAGRAA